MLNKRLASVYKAPTEAYKVPSEAGLYLVESDCVV